MLLLKESIITKERRKWISKISTCYSYRIYKCYITKPKYACECICMLLISDWCGRGHHTVGGVPRKYKKGSWMRVWKQASLESPLSSPPPTPAALAWVLALTSQSQTCPESSVHVNQINPLPKLPVFYHSNRDAKQERFQSWPMGMKFKTQSAVSVNSATCTCEQTSCSP